MLAIAQAEREVESIRRGAKFLDLNGELVALPAPNELPSQVLDTPRSSNVFEYIDDVASRNSKIEGIRREIALAKAVLHAEEELQDDPTCPPNESISDDWLLRWRDCATGVSSEKLQSLWGKVLAGEVKSPGRYSLRTMEFLRNLSQDEAKAIERISPFVVAGVIFRNDALLASAGIKFGDLLAIQELGVLSGVDSLGLRMNWNSSSSSFFEKALLSHGKLLLVRAPDPSKVLTLKVCMVTTIGKQILQLGSFQPNEEMLRAMSEAIKANGFEVQMGRYVPIDDSQIEIFDLISI
jgi:hypothetical protein